MDEFGAMADLDEMLAGIHERDMTLVMDLVINHPPDEHHCFQELRKPEDNPHRDSSFLEKAKAS